MLQVSRKTRALTAVLAVVVAFGVFAASAAALPAKFFGVVPQSHAHPGTVQHAQAGGVKTMRTALTGARCSRTAAGPSTGPASTRWWNRPPKSDIELLPFVVGTPTWAVPNATVPGTGGESARPPAGHRRRRRPPGRTSSRRRSPATGRAAPSGAKTRWSPRRPISNWQIWNEPNFKYFVAKPNPTEYGKLVTLSSKAIKSADPTAQVILAGLFAKPAGGRRLAGKRVANPTSPNWFASYFLEQMYKTNPGIKTKFQGVSLHPYVARYRQLPAEIEEVRGVLTRAGDGTKGLWITELGWSSEPPQGPSNVFAVGQPARRGN